MKLSCVFGTLDPIIQGLVVNCGKPAVVLATDGATNEVHPVCADHVESAEGHYELTRIPREDDGTFDPLSNLLAIVVRCPDGCGEKFTVPVELVSKTPGSSGCITLTIRLADDASPDAQRYVKHFIGAPMQDPLL
jgi:hypothetical protein